MNIHTFAEESKQSSKYISYRILKVNLNCSINFRTELFGRSLELNAADASATHKQGKVVLAKFH